MPRPTVREYKIKFSTEGAKKLQQTTKEVDSSFKDIKGSIQTLISGFAVQQIGRLAIQFATLAGRSQQLQNSLRNLAAREGLSFQKLMGDLTTATKGTVTQIQLMQSATQAKFLGVDLKNLPVLFEFARRRAQDTGQSIDFLVQSIVLGIGRKSPLILDNLGLQMKDLRAETEKIAKETGTWTGKMTQATFEANLQAAAVRIAKEGIESAGDEITTAADAQGRLAAASERLQIALGEMFTPAVLKGFEELTTFAEQLQLSLNKLNFAAFNRLNEFIRNFFFGEKSAFELLSNDIDGLINDLNTLTRWLGISAKGSEEWSRNAQLMHDALNFVNVQTKEFNKDLPIATEEARKFAKEIAKAELNLKNLLQPSFRPSRILKERGEGLGELETSLDGIADKLYEIQEIEPLKNFGPDIVTNIERIGTQASRAGDLLGDAFVTQWREGVSALENFERAFILMIQRIAAEIAGKAIIFGLLNFLIPGNAFSSAVGGFSNFVFGSFGGGRQFGGAVSPGKAFLVGERGPELFVPEQPGRIEPGAAQTTNITINAVDAASFRQMLRTRQGAQIIAEELREVIQ